MNSYRVAVVADDWHNERRTMYYEVLAPGWRSARDLGRDRAVEEGLEVIHVRSVQRLVDTDWHPHDVGAYTTDDVAALVAIARVVTDWHDFELNQAPLRRWSAPGPGMEVQDTPFEAAPRRAWFPGRCPGCDGAVAVCQVRLGYDSGRCPRCGTSWTARPPVSFPSVLRPRLSFGSRRTAVLDEHGHVGGGLAPLLPPDLYGLGGDD